MKKIFILCLLTSIIFISCFETEELISINADKSGTYTLKMSMNGLMSQMQAITGKESGAAIEKKDTVIYFKNYSDTSSKLSAEEKAMLHDGVFTMHMDDVADEMKFSISIPFKDVQQLPKLKHDFIAAMDKMELSKKVLGESGGRDMAGSAENGSGGLMMSNPVDSAFSWSMSGNTISNKLKDSLYISHILNSNTNLQSLKQLAPLIGDVTYKTTYLLPSPVKNYKGANTWIAEDKRKISFTSTLTDLFDKPSVMEYELSY